MATSLPSNFSNNASGIKVPNTNNFSLMTIEKISCFVHVILIVFALFGNGIVWFAFIKVKRLQRVTNFYIVSLATADLLVTSFAMTTWLSQILLRNVLVSGSVILEVYTLVDVSCGTASIMSLTFVSIDRYVAITRPFSYHDILSPSRVLGTIAFSWIYALTVSLLKFVFTSKNYTLFISIMSFFLPTVILLFTYSGIFAVARRHVRVINVVSGNRPDRKSNYVTDMKAAKVIGIVVGAFLICWAPFLLTPLALYYFELGVKFPIEGVYILKMLQYSSSALNPYIYTCLNMEFRLAVKRLVCRKCIASVDTSFSRSRMAVEGGPSVADSSVMNAR